MSKIVPTDEQEIIRKEASYSNSFKILAYAGSGKTSSMLSVCRVLSNFPSSDKRKPKGLFLAFNRNIADEAGKKLKKLKLPVDAKTWHKLALQNLSSEYKKKIGDLPKADKIIIEILMNNLHLSDMECVVDEEYLLKLHNASQRGRKTYEPFVYTQTSKKITANTLCYMIMRGISIFCTTSDTKLHPRHFMDCCPEWADPNVFYVEIIQHVLFKYAPTVWASIFDPDNVNFPVSFSHLLKIYQLSKPDLSKLYDFVVVDEGQDTSEDCLSILNNQDQSKLKLVLVGDSYQQIYSWRNSIDALTNINISRTLYLSKSFRFGQKLANLATAVLKNTFDNVHKPIKGNETINTVIYEGQGFDLEQFDVVLTRTNAGAFTAYMTAIDSNPDLVIDVNVDVNSFYEFLLAYLDLSNYLPLKPESPLYMFESLEHLYEYMEQNPYDSEFSAPLKLIDKFGVDQLIFHIQKLLHLQAKKSKNPNNLKVDLEITTCHKAKGLEWDKVLIAPDFADFVCIKDKENGEFKIFKPRTDEEARLFYVAITRAKEVLAIESFPIYFVDDLINKYCKSNSKDLQELTVTTSIAPESLYDPGAEVKAEIKKQIKKDKEYLDHVLKDIKPLLKGVAYTKETPKLSRAEISEITRLKNQNIPVLNDMAKKYIHSSEVKGLEVLIQNGYSVPELLELLLKLLKAGEYE